MCSVEELARAKRAKVLLAAPTGRAAKRLAEPHRRRRPPALAHVVEAHVRSLRSSQPGSPTPVRYREAARLLTGSADASVEDGVAWIHETVTLLEVPGLRAFGLRPGHADEVVAKAAKASSMQGNPVVLSDDDLHVILAEAV